MKSCSKCKESKEIHHFWKNGERRHSKCKQCMRLRNKQPYSTEKHYLKCYGLTLNDVKNLMTQQNNCCALCDSSLDRFVVDHDHSTGQVRGLLCYPCNTGLGFFKESPDQLNKAILYLRRI